MRVDSSVGMPLSGQWMDRCPYCKETVPSPSYSSTPQEAKPLAMSADSGKPRWRCALVALGPCGDLRGALELPGEQNAQD